MDRMTITPLKVIFLDFDGVLTNQKTKFQVADPVCVENLNLIIDSTQAKLVITSTWRLLPYNIQEILKEWGVKGNMIGQVPHMKDRSSEIYQWLLTHQLLPLKYVILDDESLGSFLSSRHIQPVTEIGLTRSEAYEAIRILSTND